MESAIRLSPAQIQGILLTFAASAAKDKQNVNPSYFFWREGGRDWHGESRPWHAGLAYRVDASDVLSVENVIDRKLVVLLAREIFKFLRGEDNSNL